MGELSIRRNRNISVPRYQGTGKAEKQSASAKVPQGPGRTAATVSDTLRQQIGRASCRERV